MVYAPHCPKKKPNKQTKNTAAQLLAVGIKQGSEISCNRLKTKQIKQEEEM